MTTDKIYSFNLFLLRLLTALAFIGLCAAVLVGDYLLRERPPYNPPRDTITLDVLSGCKAYHVKAKDTDVYYLRCTSKKSRNIKS